MSEQDIDWHLVQEVQKGNKKAFDALVLKYQHKIANLIGRYIRDSSEVMDVAQEAFIKAYRAIPGFRGESAFYTWLYRIAINTAKNYIVAQGRRPPSEDIDATEAEQFEGGHRLTDQGTPESMLIRDEVETMVYKTIAELPPDLRTAISLREFEGMSYEDIAAIMECPVGTVRSRIFRAREAIDKQIKTLMGVSEENSVNLRE